MEKFLHTKILSGVSGGIFYIDKGKISYANPAAENILNKSAAEMLNKTFAEIFVNYAENDDFVQVILDAVYDLSNSHENIVSYFDGEKFKCLHTKTSFLREGSKKMGVFLMIDDVTEVLKLSGVELTLQKIHEMNQELKLQTNN